MIRVLVVDDHPFVRAGVSVVLGQALGIEVVGQCADGDQVVGMAAAVHPDVVLMDVQMPVTSGPEATRSLLACQPLVRVLMLTGTMAGAELNEAARAGAVGACSSPVIQTNWWMRYAPSRPGAPCGPRASELERLSQGQGCVARGCDAPVRGRMTVISVPPAGPAPKVNVPPRFSTRSTSKRSPR